MIVQNWGSVHKIGSIPLKMLLIHMILVPTCSFWMKIFENFNIIRNFLDSSFQLAGFLLYVDTVSYKSQFDSFTYHFTQGPSAPVLFGLLLV